MARTWIQAPLATQKIWSPFSSWFPTLSSRRSCCAEPPETNPVISTQQCTFHIYGYSYQYVYYSACICFSPTDTDSLRTGRGCEMFYWTTGVLEL